MSIQYKLIKDEIVPLYLSYQKSYESTFISYIDAVVRKIVGDFDSTAFWKDRKGCGEKLRVAIDEKLQEVHAHCTNV